MGVFGVMFFVFSAQAPLTGVVGPTPITIAMGNGSGAPAASLIVGAVICLFAVGFIEMSRHVNVSGAFYAYIAEALGPRWGVGAAWVAILAYGAVQAAMYGLYGSIASGLLSSILGVAVPWWLVVLVTIAIVQLLGSRNIELGARVLAVLVLAEFVLLLAFCIGVLLRGGGPQGFDLAASFSPAAIFSGAPGVAVVFAVASMIGFESTAIYSSEAKDPEKTIPRATYLSVIVVAVFYAFALWMIVSFYGADHVVDAANESLKGDSSSFVLNAIAEVLGGWAATIAGVLLITSLLAGVIAFHNGVNRYVHSLASRGGLPHALARTNSHHAPSRAAMLQSVMAVISVVPFAIAGLDPALTLFPWGGGVAVLALLVLYVLCSISVVVYFRGRSGVSAMRTKIIPVIAMVLLLGLMGLVVANFGALVGDNPIASWVLIALVPLAFIGGLISTKFFPMTGPPVYEPGPFRNTEHDELHGVPGLQEDGLAEDGLQDGLQKNHVNNENTERHI